MFMAGWENPNRFFIVKKSEMKNKTKKKKGEQHYVVDLSYFQFAETFDVYANSQPEAINMAKEEAAKEWPVTSMISCFSCKREGGKS